MPLDDTTKHYALAPQADPFDYRTFTPGPEGLRKLAWVLRHPEVWPQHRWSFLTICDDVGACGTIGCAVGVAHRMWPAGIAMSLGVASAAKAFGIPQEDARYLFASVAPYVGETYAKRPQHVTPLDVADAIDSYLAQSRAPETGGGR